MDFSRTEYPALLASLQPDQAINVLNDRVALISKINSDIADWLSERRRVEEVYVAGLRKLARRQQQDGAAALGIFQMPWQRIVSGTENLAAAHEALATKIEHDVETPLRTFSGKNREMQAVHSTQGNLASIAKDLANAQKKAAKGGRGAGHASSSAGDAQRQWETQAPYVFEQLQALDESRVHHLRDVLTQFQTHEVDSIEKMRASAESCLNALLNIETADEIKTFTAKVSGGRGSDGTLMRRRSSAAASARPTSSSLRPPPTPPPPRHTDDRHSQRSGSYGGQDRLAPLPEPTPQKEKSKLGGLKRLGTVMGRRKSTAPPVPQQSDEKRKTRSFAPFRRGDSSRSFHDLEATNSNISNEARQPSPSREATYEPPPREEPHSGPAAVLTNGAPSQNHLDGSSETAPIQPTLVEPIAPVQHQAAPQPQPTPPQPPQVEQPPTIQEPQAPQSSAVGPITQAQQETALANLTGEELGRNFKIRDQPIQEDESEAQLAMRNMANQLRTQAQSSGINRVQGSMRGRRDVRNTMFVPSGVDAPTAPPSQTVPKVAIPPPSGENILASPIQRPPTAGVLHDDHGIGSDTGSIHSSRSLAAPAHHIDLHEPGLNASIVETVHSWFTESGISKSFVLDEIALAYNPPTTGASNTDSETIRLAHFQLLDKVAVNPAFVTQVKPTAEAAEEQAGTYTLSLPLIRKPTPAVALKYQLHMEEAHLAAYSPLLLTPAWQIVDGQASVIIMYSGNPVFTPPLTLKNVLISVSLDADGAKATSALMSPTTGASFRRKASTVVWRFPDLVLRAEQERLLARFMTGGLAKRGSVEVKFEIAGRIASEVGVERAVAGSAEGDPFADEAEGRGSGEGWGWEGVATRRALVSGRYTAA